MTTAQEIAIRHELAQGRPPHLVARHYIGVTVAEVERMAASYYDYGRRRQRLLVEHPPGRSWEDRRGIVITNF